MFAVKNLREIVETELQRWPHVTYEIDICRRHTRVIFYFNEQKRFVVFAKTASDWRASKNQVRDMRKELRNLGAICA